MRKYIVYILLALLLSATVVFFLNRSHSKTGTAPYNLLLITLDTTRADRLGCYSDSHARTPALDTLASQGVLFENCYSPVPLTLPAHCSLFTGRWPFAHGVRNNGSYKLAAEESTLAEKLKSAGYDTAAIVAAYVLKAKFGLAQGFNFYNDLFSYEEKAGNIDAEISADRVYGKFQEWLERNTDKPSFLWVHFYDPHKPYAPPPAYLQASANDAYRGEVAYMDHYIGRMLADLNDRRLLEHTLIVIVGDHGEAFGEHGEKGHGIFCYDESVRIPLIFVCPGLLKKPARVNRQVSMVDVMPTVLEMLGIGAEKNAQGNSLFASMIGAEKTLPAPIYLESMYGRELKNWAPLTGLIDGHFKYISLPQAELYDLQADPGERTNLFFKNNPLTREMDRKLAKFIRANRTGNVQNGRTAMDDEDKSKLAALGYISSFAPAGRSGIDPKTGVGYEARFSDMSAALDRGEIAWVEAEALRLRDETAKLKLSLAYIMLNYVYEKKQQWDKLEANLRSACELFSDNPGQVLIFQIRLLEFYFANDNFSAAEQLAATILRADPEKTRVLEILGGIDEKRQSWLAALNWYRKAQKSEPGNATLSKKVIKMLIETGDKRGALAECEALLLREGGFADADLLYSAAMLSVQARDGARAEELLSRVIELRPIASSWFDYALVLGRNGKFSQAIAAMEKALAATPNGLDAERLQAADKALQVWKGGRR